LSSGERENIKETMRQWTALVLGLAWRALTNPRVAVDLVSLAWTMRARHWLRTPPFLPLPPPEYLRWRMYTAYGDEHALPSAREVVRYARWRREVLLP
jgi:hypothetical protein